MKCERGNRCIKCRKLNLKRAVRNYQKSRKDVFENSEKDTCGNLIVAPFFVEGLLNQRAKIGKLARNLQNKTNKDKPKDSDIPQLKLETDEDYLICSFLQQHLIENLIAHEDSETEIVTSIKKHMDYFKSVLNNYEKNKQ